VEGLTQRDLVRLGKHGPDRAPPIEIETVTVNGPSGPRAVQVPAGVDPGFGYAPGASLGAGTIAPIAPPEPAALATALERTAQLVLEKTLRLPAAQAAASAAEILARGRIAQAIDAGFAQWQAAQVPGRYFAGALAVDLAGAVDATAAVVAVDGPALASAAGSDAALVIALQSLPATLRAPSAVLFDSDAGVLLYVSAEAGPGGARAVTRIRLGIGGAPNTLDGAFWRRLDELRDDALRGRLRLVQGFLE
jgi:hypothetical protein